MLEPGARLAHFTLERRVALGGMAEIWLARDEARPASAPSVALKVLQASFAADPVFRAMFVDEANLIQRARHEHIIEFYEILESDGLLIQSMPFVEGCDLRHLVGRAHKAGMSLPLEVAFAVTLPMVRALSHIHGLTDERGRSLEIVHRDVTPHNVMVARDGRVLLLDFGIARATDRLARTRTGMIKGKTAYMAPEQAAAEPVTARTDIFALGVVLWEILAMRPLFTGKTDAEIIHRITREDAPPIQSFAPSVPDAIADTVMRMLARSPAARPATMAEVERDLTASLEPLGLLHACSANALRRWVAPLMGGGRARTLQLSLDDVVDVRSPGESAKTSTLDAHESDTPGALHGEVHARLSDDAHGGLGHDDVLAAVLDEGRAPDSSTEQSRSDPTITMSFLDLESVRAALTTPNAPLPRQSSTSKLEASSIPQHLGPHDFDAGTAVEGLRMPSRSEIRVAVEEVETVALHASALPDFEDLREALVTSRDRLRSDVAGDPRSEITRTRTGSLIDPPPADDTDPPSNVRAPEVPREMRASSNAQGPRPLRTPSSTRTPSNTWSLTAALQTAPPEPEVAALSRGHRWDVARLLTLFSAVLLLVSIVLLLLAIFRGSS